MNEEILRELEGLQTLETIAETLNITKQSALNLISRLKRERHATVRGGGKLKRLYKITMRKQLPRDKGMFDIINKYSPMKLAPWYDHQVHGHYGPEEALIDAIKTESFRVILASMRLFNHITNWPKLYQLSLKDDCWQKVGALYDVAKLYFKVKKMPKRYNPKPKKWQSLSQIKNKENFTDIAYKWHVNIPYNENDMEAIV